ncbi:MAG: acyl-CoA dehydrogenase family protein [Elainella sp. C42_A2020_010]|nr:acyl-CoA dehydrogenase family protein [Elainella sp. C42_A2020_010]RNJ67233.1 MAG: monooxygenase [Leptolyngbya sp. IPPAS B-1204]
MIATLHQKNIEDYRAIAINLANELKQTVQERDHQSGVPNYEIQCLRKLGLLPLVVPQAYGGVGATWVEALPIVREIAKADSSTAQLYGYHLLLSVLGEVSGTPKQADRYYRETAQRQLFWGNAINVRDTRLTIEPEGNHYRVNGTKTFCTGAVVADRRVCAALPRDSDIPILFVLPSDRVGVTYNHDWDTMGQRRTASGSFSFDNVLVQPDEILPTPNPEDAFPTIFGVLGPIILTHIHLGVAEGALEAAKDYTCTQTRPWLTSGVDQITQDPYILHHYGDLWAQLQGAIALTTQATVQVQQAWDRGNTLTQQERGEVALVAAAAKALSIRVGLAITNRMFEVMGARATANRYGFDRYWRDMRTFTLHDPVDYKLREIGAWVLNGEFPFPTPYS